MNPGVMSTTNDAILNAVLKVGGDPSDLPFWLACAQGKFLLHRCGHCGNSYWPASRCIEHGDAAMSWVEASGKAVLHTYTILHRAYLPAMQDKLPFVVGVVQLAEGPFYHTNIIECDHDQLAIGMPLTVRMQSHDSGLTLPMFTPASLRA